MKQPSETLESKAFARWLSRQPDLLFSKIPIGDSTLTGKEGKQLQAMGVRPGVPDFVIVHRGTKRLLWVEMKRAKPASSKVSDAQWDWIDALDTANIENRSNSAVVAFGFNEAKEYVLDYYEKEGLR